LLPVPPLQNFVPPLDVIADALTKSNRRSASTVKELFAWARDYFCAFMRNEGLEELVILWEVSRDLLEKRKNSASTAFGQGNEDGKESDGGGVHQGKEINEMEVKVKSLKDKYSAHIGLEVEPVSEERKEEEDCLAWIQDAHNKVYQTLQETYVDSRR
jgi:hypothetical protein